MEKQIPNHIAIIMDGNGRWAKRRGLPRTFGHKEGAAALRKIITHAAKIGVKYLTVYAFSTENWKRSQEEVSALMFLFKSYIKNEEKNITLVFVAIVFSIIVGMIIGKSLLKYKEGEPDVVGSFSMNRDENLTVVANRKNISDKEAFARLLLKMYKENSFHSIKFSTDHGYATSLDMTVYSWKEDIENGKSIMQIEFRPIEYGKDYDIVHNLDKYVLFIDGTEIK